jgi:hypothetical protein
METVGCDAFPPLKIYKIRIYCVHSTLIKSDIQFDFFSDFSLLQKNHLGRSSCFKDANVSTEYSVTSMEHFKIHSRHQ